MKRPTTTRSPSLTPPPSETSTPKATKKARKESPEPTIATAAVASDIAPVQQLPSPTSQANMSSDGEEEFGYVDDDFEEDGFGDDGEVLFDDDRITEADSADSMSDVEVYDAMSPDIEGELYRSGLDSSKTDGVRSTAEEAL